MKKTENENTTDSAKTETWRTMGGIGERLGGKRRAK